MGLISWSVFVGILASILYMTARVKEFEMNEVKLAPPRPLTGRLAATSKNTLKSVDRLFEGQLVAPECQLFHKGALYSTSMAGPIVKIVDGKIVKSLEIFKHNPKCRSHGCSIPLGIRHWKEETFVFADAKLGIFTVDFKTETFKHIFHASTVIGDWSNTFADDFDFVANDSIIFSDMAPKCGLSGYMLCALEWSRDGRLIKVNLNTGAYEIVADKLISPNGVISHPDKQSVIVASTSASELIRVYNAGPKKGKVEVFADGLPGLPDNLRATSSGKTFWVAFYCSTVNGRLFTQWFAEYPSIRKYLAYYSEYLFALDTYTSSKHVIFIEMDFEGNVVSSYHDLEGRLKEMTNIIDDEKYFYFGSASQNCIRRALKPRVK
ncbi:unnamed protein product [Bursaphelenchus xylophilus]|uniref:(pine wood nematode) hypothetical protein n=1 Tax=Bursaphelenchus xylophilus TaxID=6326 RepID=A0A1I7RUB0_BURXY|nr:unnamed protein product [Bursaphelenchus xylophilus]CAG9113998.1 unnamed protein product [Bursaphelenchus xylophilus]